MIRRRKTPWAKLGFGILLPVLISLLFYILRGNRQLMDGWVEQILKPVAQCLGRIWSIVPFSVGECIIVGALIGAPTLLIFGIFQGVREKTIRPLGNVCLLVLMGGLWIFAALNWMWNVTYYATGFTEKSGLDTSPYSVEELFYTTAYFAQQTALYSTQVERTEELSFGVSQQECLEGIYTVYDNLEEEFPFLEMEDVGAKPIFFSRVQSILGFTGIYFPFTGEANVNVDAPHCLLPAITAHELAHQRMVASEDEANFLGVAASVTSDNVTYRYSGYLFGLMQLSNALYSVSPDAWQAIWDAYATEEMYTDWQENYDYWDALESDVEETATQAYDNFLKGNDQELGMQSYGACVDLLVAYFGGQIGL